MRFDSCDSFVVGFVAVQQSLRQQRRITGEELVTVDPTERHAALMGPAATNPDSWLIRDADSGAAMTRSAGAADILILRGNGAVTLGVDLAQAVARMWLLERTAELSLRAWAAGSATDISTEEQQWWRSLR